MKGMTVTVAESIEDYNQSTSLYDKQKRALQMKAYALKNREKILAYSRAYYKKYYSKNKVKERERIVCWKLANREKVSGQGKRRYARLKIVKLRGESVKRRENGAEQ